MDLYPGAVWRPSVIQHPTRQVTRGICIHNTYGSHDGDLETLDGPSVDCHFYVTKSGDVFQFLDPDSMSWTAMSTANHTCVHIETEGSREVAWTPMQHRAVAKLCAWLCGRYEVPVRKVDPRGTADGPDWQGLFDHRDLEGIDGNDHGDGVPPEWPGWPRLLAQIKQDMAPADTRTLARRLEDSGIGPLSVKRILAALGRLPDGYTGKPTPDDSALFRRLRTDGGLGENSARQVIYARRFVMANAA